MQKLSLRIVSAMAAWKNLADSMVVHEPAVTTNTFRTGNPFGGMIVHEHPFKIGGLETPPGRLHEVRFYWSRLVSEVELRSIFAVADQTMDLNQCAALFGKSAITDWRYLTGFTNNYKDGKVYVRQFRFSVSGQDVVLTVVAIYVPFFRADPVGGPNWEARDEG